MDIELNVFSYEYIYRKKINIVNKRENKVSNPFLGLHYVLECLSFGEGCWNLAFSGLKTGNKHSTLPTMYNISL